jgi:signal transduction histidine kinase
VRPKMEKTLGEIHSQVTRLLELSRLESGALQVHMEWVDLRSVFLDLRSLFEGQAQSRGLRLRFGSLNHRKRRVVWCDRRMLESILQNLISNALKNTAAGAVYIGTRWRATYPHGQQLALEVRDSGRGIPPEQHPYLFDAYRTFDDRKAAEGHGLGLAIAKAQASYLGCEISLRSAVGAGSVFLLCGLATEVPRKA